MQLQFTKMHGIGNDYIYIDCTHAPLPCDPGALSLKLSDRNRSIGGNGLVLILPSEPADFRMRMFNADGSEGAMCGNAIRCVAKYVYDNGLTDKTKLAIETPSGMKYLTLQLTDGKVSTVQVDMGVPLIGNEPLTIRVGRKEYTGWNVSMGNPHFVTFVEDVWHHPVTTDGPYIETMSVFPDRTNVEFIHPVGENHLQMRVWERGSGETMACGTGACAAAVAAVRQGICEIGVPISVDLPGGTLTICFDGQMVLMTGDAETVFSGTIELDENEL